MQIFQIQGFFAPFVAVLAGCAMLILWYFNRKIRYLPYFTLSLFAFACGFILSQVIFEKMTFANAIASSTTYYTVSGLMVHSALIRLDDKLNLPVHLSLYAAQVIGLMIILHLGFSNELYLIYTNLMMGIPMAIGAYVLYKHNKRDIQSAAISFAYACIAGMAIISPSIILSFGETVTSENYFSSHYWLFLSFLTVLGIFMVVAAFGFTVGSDLLASVEENASRDFLSGLLTRGAFDKEAHALIEKYGEINSSIGLLMCDIDYFKQINDKYGHHAGDIVIRDIGDLIARAIPDAALAGRTGGEEFAIVIPGCDIRTIRLFAEGLRTAVGMLSFEGMPETKKITASFGVTVLRSGEPLTLGFKRADEALYEAKNSGRNRVIASSLNVGEISNTASG